MIILYSITGAALLVSLLFSRKKTIVVVPQPLIVTIPMAHSLW